MAASNEDLIGKRVTIPATGAVGTVMAVWDRARIFSVKVRGVVMPVLASNCRWKEGSEQ